MYYLFIYGTKYSHNMFPFEQWSVLKGTLSITKGLSHQELLQNFAFHYWKFYLDIVKITSEVCVPDVNPYGVEKIYT
jgi:hypothetical protein